MPSRLIVVAVDAWPLERAIAAASDEDVGVVVLDGYPTGTGLRAMAEVTSSRPTSACSCSVRSSRASTCSSRWRQERSATSRTQRRRRRWPMPSGHAARRATRCCPRRSFPLVQHLRPGGRGIVVAGSGRTDVELTNRELEVFVLLRQARTTAEMASYLVVSKGTIRTHVSALIHKLGVDDRHQLAARWAGDHGRQTGDRTASNTVGNSSPRTAAKSIGAHHPAAAGGRRQGVGGELPDVGALQRVTPQLAARRLAVEHEHVRAAGAGWRLRLVCVGGVRRAGPTVDRVTSPMEGC